MGSSPFPGALDLEGATEKALSMRERLAARARKPEEAHSEESTLRRQLEGGVEELEAALERYRQLTAALRARRWKRRLQQPNSSSLGGASGRKRCRKSPRWRPPSPRVSSAPH